MPPIRSPQGRILYTASPSVRWGGAGLVRGTYQKAFSQRDQDVGGRRLGRSKGEVRRQSSPEPNQAFALTRRPSGLAQTGPAPKTHGQRSRMKFHRIIP